MKVNIITNKPRKQMGKLEIKISKIDKLKKIFLYVKHNNEDNKETKKK